MDNGKENGNYRNYRDYVGLRGIYRIVIWGSQRRRGDVVGS